jgi:hypothetical protein
VASLIPRKLFASKNLVWHTVGFMSLLIAFGLAILTPTMAPIKRGSVEELWENACHLHEWEKAIGGHGHVYKPREGWFLYDLQYLHHSDLYKVPEAEVFASFDQVVEKLRDKENPNIFEHARAGFEKWNNRKDIDQRNPEILLADIWDAYLDKNEVKNPRANFILEGHAWLIELRWAQSKWYWFNIVFEWFFLSGLILFAAWPILHKKSWWNYAAHWGLLPLLFVLPAYMGYGTLSFSYRIPCGGVIYPWLTFALRQSGSCNDLDRHILDHVPQLLEPLSSEIPIPLMGRMRDIIWSGMPGPTTLAIVGLVIASLVFACHKLLDRVDRHLVVVARLVDPQLPPE